LYRKHPRLNADNTPDNTPCVIITPVFQVGSGQLAGAGLASIFSLFYGMFRCMYVCVRYYRNHLLLSGYFLVMYERFDRVEQDNWMIFSGKILQVFADPVGIMDCFP